MRQTIIVGLFAAWIGSAPQVTAASPLGWNKAMAAPSGKERPVKVVRLYGNHIL